MQFLKKNFYIISITILVLFVAMILIFRKPVPEIPPLKNRIGAIGMGSEWTNTRQTIDALLEKIRQQPNDPKLKITLAQAYIQEARITGDHAYYDPAVIKILNAVLQKDPNNIEALTTLATAYLSQHHFDTGLQIGKQAQKVAPMTSMVYGILTDAYVELGKYDSAVMMADKMCAIRPDLRSYSRISYVREIYGDYPGATAAMKMAVQAGYPGLEQTAWVRCYLGKLYEITGNLDSASLHYQIALGERPNYAYAIAGLGRVALAKKNYAEAIKDYEEANSLIKDNAFGDELVDLYTDNHETKKADSLMEEVIKDLNAQANSNDNDPNAGHYADKELAYAYLKLKQNDQALKHAEIEYNRRPDNIEINEMMSWVYYKRGEYAKSLPYIEKAMRTGSQNAVMLCRAGLIYEKNNNPQKGTVLIKRASTINPYLPQDLITEATPYMPLAGN
ncbi:MAG: tetratricopeptide repeat protein [Chitinophagales bacterium]|nr:tetratricopeptide repeat protein [Chitinophagales bacterium]